MNKLYYFRSGIALIIGILSLLAFTGIFYPVKIFDVQITALAQRLLVDLSITVVILSVGMLLMTFLFGRVYCSTLCPLGLFQEFLMLFFRKKNTVQKNQPYKYFIAAAVFGTLIGGTAYFIRLIDPYALFGSAAGGAWLGITVAVLIMALVWFRGRFFCANICPVGTVLGLISKHAVNKIYMDTDNCIACGICTSKCPTGSIDFKHKTVNNETCIKCFRCLNGCRKNGIHYGPQAPTKIAFSPTRRSLLVNGAVIAVFALAVKSGIEFSKTAAAKVKKAILPAGAGNKEEFTNRCLNCNLCVQNCPMKIIKKADDYFPAVHIDYSNNFCDYNCNKCSQICPAGAIKKLTLTEKQKTQIGLAIIDTQQCIKCGLCVMKCPRQIIKKENGEYPQISADECIGCGACQNVCPVKAITISAVDRQRTL